MSGMGSESIQARLGAGELRKRIGSAAQARRTRLTCVTRLGRGPRDQLCRGTERPGCEPGSQAQSGSAMATQQGVPGLTELRTAVLPRREQRSGGSDTQVRQCRRTVSASVYDLRRLRDQYRLLNNNGLDLGETATVSDLSPRTAKEAKLLVPSLQASPCIIAVVIGSADSRCRCRRRPSQMRSSTQCCSSYT